MNSSELTAMSLREPLVAVPVRVLRVLQKSLDLAIEDAEKFIADLARDPRMPKVKLTDLAALKDIAVEVDDILREADED